jgi:hypothetical protein
MVRVDNRIRSPERSAQDGRIRGLERGWEEASRSGGGRESSAIRLPCGRACVRLARVSASRSVVRGVALATATAALVLPGTAFAQTLRHADPAKDVQRSSATHVGNAPRNRSADIVHVALTHDADAVTTRIRLRHLAPKSWAYLSRVTTPSGTYVVTGHHENGLTQFLLTRASGRTVACAALSNRVRVAVDRLTVTVPDRCLHDPSWVRVGVGYAVPIGAGNAVYADDALRRAGVKESHLTLSRRLY